MNNKKELDIAENRNHLNYSKWIYIKRILWTFGKFFFRNSPRIAFGYRNTILRLFGAKIGKYVHIYSSTIIWFPWNLEIGDWSAIGEETLIYNLGKVTIGEKATISHRVHVCAGTHDYTDPALPLLRPEIHIGNQTWICANTFIGRHKYFIAVGKTCHSSQISGIMVGVQIIEIGPGVYHMAFL